MPRYKDLTKEKKSRSSLSDSLKESPVLDSVPALMEEKEKKFSGTPIPKSVIDLPLSRGKNEVSLSAFSYLFSELVQYCQSKVDLTQELEKRLSDAGYGIGLRVLELLSWREKSSRKEKNVIAMLQFIHGTVWKVLFGKAADALQKSTEQDDEYYIYDRDPITNRFISVPKNLGSLNTAAFIAGIINGILDGAEFTAHVQACWNASDSRTVYVIKFDPSVLKRPET